ncbi:DNA-3-methyladenine glycosylase family protein [Leekyejoonella antrihumi]|uniref:DNA-3-methyladenine glycosylase 2 family protein n=1 Tax=Leekyejoonella antrihumi TaxID=1660198 RepID=A0A563DZL8_9MICO|nr:DNA-3-methyladenine glycosylase 2 family protein [Leekyejoonella antrihumi]TWP35084.1 DNA-3-methyladenine glycosylase 2 family protein [Leekyejoonella antrihumi]
MTSEPQSTDWTPGRPVPLEAILAPLRRGSGDPTWSSAPGEVWRGVRTPAGSATLRMQLATARHGDRVVARAWGDGASWVLDRLPGLLGADDDVSGFEPAHPALARAQHLNQHWRVGRTGLVLESLLPAVIEQRVTGKQAFGSYRQLVRRYGSAAPGPGAERGLMVPPGADGWRGIPSWEWLRAGVDAQRADTIMRVLQVAHALQECTVLPRGQAWSRLQSIRGVGSWTVSETAQRALGDADAVSFGDYHVAKDLGWALTGAPVDDVGLERLLEPYRGHRYRVQHLVMAARLGRPRRGPRMPVPSHLP